MTDDARSEARPTDTKDAGNQKSTSDPRVRLAFFAIFVLTLPFTWGETASCNGPSKTVTGLESMERNPDIAIVLTFIVITPILLGFVQHVTRRPWIRAVMELMSAITSAFGTFYCFIVTMLSSFFAGRSGQMYLAPLIATMAMFSMTLHACLGFVSRIAEMVRMRQNDNRGD